MSKQLQDFINATAVLNLQGPSNPLINDLVYDSRKCTENSMFFALSGLHTDGSFYIPQAIKNGAKAVVYSSSIEDFEEGITYIKVKDSRFSMSAIAAEFYDNPSKDLVVIGVTGTEGKSTTVSLIYQFLTLLGKKAGLISTVDFCVDSKLIPNEEHQTTPEATTIHKRLKEMLNNGLEYAVLEASSHGLSPKTNRLGNVFFDVGVMTNVTHEHLEFHGSHEQYKLDKSNLFKALDTHNHIKNGERINSFGVINEEDPAAECFRNSTTKNVYGFSTWASTRQGLSASEIIEDAKGIDFLLAGPGGKSIYTRINLPGAFNVHNTLAAILVVSRLLDIPIKTLSNKAKFLKPVKGRMSPIDEGQDFEVLVDYAHTPSSFFAVFPPLRKRIKGRIISLFGSGGERDTLKRAEQGQIASAYSDIIILADEDPRGEDPVKLLEMIASGATDKELNKDLFIIPNRQKAIRKAFSIAKKGDLVLLLGKGHENSIIHKDYVEPYDEITEAKKALKELGFTKNKE